MKQTRLHVAINPDVYSRLKNRAAAENRSVKFVAERCLTEALDRTELDEQLSKDARLTDIQVFVNSHGNVSVANSSEDLQSGEFTSIDYLEIDMLAYKLEQIRSDLLSGLYDSEEAA